MTTRTDIHRPSAIVPAEYEFVAFGYRRVEDLGDAQFLQEERAKIRRHMERTGGAYSTHDHGGNCHCCGAHCIYDVVFYHKATNSYIRVGTDCAEKLDMADASRFRRRVTEARKQVAGKRKAQAILSDAGLSRAWEMQSEDDARYEALPNNLRHRTLYDKTTVCDIVAKLVKYGSISDKALGFLRVLVNRIDNAIQIEAERAAAAAALPPVKVGRYLIEGEIVSVKSPMPDHRSYGWAATTKMLVKLADGTKVFGSMPKGFRAEDKGRVVRFTATVKASDKDRSFGYFSRPKRMETV